MVAELVLAWRRLSQPFHISFWLNHGRPLLDSKTVLLISFPKLTSEQRTSLRKRYSHSSKVHVKNSDRPILPTSPEPRHVELKWTLYRAYVVIMRTIILTPKLLTKKISWAAHITETEDLARLERDLSSSDSSCLHLGSLSNSPLKDLEMVKRKLRSFRHQHLELWILDRDAQVAYLPPFHAVPKTKLSVEELVLMAREISRGQRASLSPKSLPKAESTIRVMTYNLHSCYGLDGRYSVERIAALLTRYDPDVVLLQELDRCSKRSRGEDQLQRLTELWPSEGAFFPLLELHPGQYGIGYLSRLPVIAQESVALPPARQRLPQEQRGLMKLTLAIGGHRELEIFNTHLGLTKKERLAQIQGLLAHANAGSFPENLREQVLIGDFNCSPQSEEYQLLKEHWTPTQEKPKKNWFGTFPLRHLDYCFVRGSLEVVATHVPRDSISRLASDHLPLITDLRLS